MILQLDKVVELCLELFLSSNLIHFQLEWRNSNWNSAKKKIICFAQLSGADWPRFENLAQGPAQNEPKMIGTVK
jgi:hypothetical protein